MYRVSKPSFRKVFLIPLSNLKLDHYINYFEDYKGNKLQLLQKLGKNFSLHPNQKRNPSPFKVVQKLFELRTVFSYHITNVSF